MIDPTTLIKPTSSTREKQIFLIFCIFVAGRNSDLAANKLSKFLSKCKNNELPFNYLKNNIHDLHNILVANKVGQYNRIETAIKQAIHLNVEECSLEDLLNIHGIGMKTAKFFLVYSRSGEKHAILDVHILKWMRRYYDDAPTNTPPPSQYWKWETRFFKLVESEFGDNIDLTKIDLLIWSKESGRL